MAVLIVYPGHVKDMAQSFRAQDDDRVFAPVPDIADRNRGNLWASSMSGLVSQLDKSIQSVRADRK